MSIDLFMPPHQSQRKPLAACIGAIFALTAAPAAYATSFVTNCNDSGAGSLRSAVSVAAEGEIVDATGLTASSTGCASSTISLTTGAIGIGRNNLTIKGPGLTALTVTGKYKGVIQQAGIFAHFGTGTLQIQDLTINKGYNINTFGGDAKGGCIYSKGNVLLLNVGVYGCKAKAISGESRGGGIYTVGQTTLINSAISHNTAYGATGNRAIGGGVYALGNFHSTASSIVGNTATSPATTGDNGYVGGVLAKGPSVGIYHSTIAGNHADANIGGLQLTNSTGTLIILNSTISGNSAERDIGGIYSNSRDAHIYNATIAFNTAGTSYSHRPAGWFLQGPVGATAEFQSTLIANNAIGSPAVASDISGNVNFRGSNNLVRTPGISLPDDTIVGKCPLLGPLKNNGGPTSTHALLGHSPAIDQGNNAHPESYDQRRSPYLRTSGSATDIGAYEVDQTDKIFDTDFEGCS